MKLWTTTSIPGLTDNPTMTPLGVSILDNVWVVKPGECKYRGELLAEAMGIREQHKVGLGVLFKNLGWGRGWGTGPDAVKTWPKNWRLVDRGDTAVEGRQCLAQLPRSITRESIRLYINQVVCAKSEIVDMLASIARGYEMAGGPTLDIVLSETEYGVGVWHQWPAGTYANRREFARMHPATEHIAGEGTDRDWQANMPMDFRAVEMIEDYDRRFMAMLLAELMHLSGWWDICRGRYGDYTRADYKGATAAPITSNGGHRLFSRAIPGGLSCPDLYLNGPVKVVSAFGSPKPYQQRVLNNQPVQAGEVGFIAGTAGWADMMQAALAGADAARRPGVIGGNLVPFTARPCHAGDASPDYADEAKLVIRRDRWLDFWTSYCGPESELVLWANPPAAVPNTGHLDQRDLETVRQLLMQAS